MIVVKVELWPGGDNQYAEEIGRMGIANVSDLNRKSNYLAVFVDDKGNEDFVAVKGHERNDGFWSLMGKVVNNMEDQRESEMSNEEIFTEYELSTLRLIESSFLEESNARQLKR